MKNKKQIADKDVISENLSLFLSILSANDRTYDFYMSDVADDEWEYAKNENGEIDRVQWAKKEDEFWRDYGYPSHCFYNPKILGSGTWLIHFTDADPRKICSEGFIGRDADILGLTTRFKEGTNLGSLALAYRVDKIGYSRDSGFGKYGKNAIIFQVTEAVSALHFGDEELQVVFDIKQAYNYHPVIGDRDTLSYYDENGEEIATVDRNNSGVVNLLELIQRK